MEHSLPDNIPMPHSPVLGENNDALVKKFTDTLTAIGGKVVPVKTVADIRYHLLTGIDIKGRNLTTVPLLGDLLEQVNRHNINSYALQNVDDVVIDAHFAVAENGALWVTDDKLMLRVLPFICKHLSVIVNASDIVATMYEAYSRIGNTNYDFGTFVAGPSKAADIEQSLVLGARGTGNITVFLTV